MGSPDSSLPEGDTSRGQLWVLCSLSSSLSISELYYGLKMLSLIRLTVLVLMDVSEDVCLVNSQLWRRQTWRVLSLCGPEELIACSWVTVTWNWVTVDYGFFPSAQSFQRWSHLFSNDRSFHFKIRTQFSIVKFSFIAHTFMSFEKYLGSWNCEHKLQNGCLAPWQP